MPVANGTGLIDRLAADLEAQGHAAGTAAAVALNTARKWVKDPGFDIREAVKLAEGRVETKITAHATPDELEKVGRKALHRLALAEGLKTTLDDPDAKHGMAYASAQAFFNGGKAKVSLSEPEPYKGDVDVVLGRLAEEIEIDRLLVEAVPKLRSPKGQFHGMHGMERRGNKGKLLKGEGAVKCETCGAIKPGKDATCPKGHRPVQEAVWDRLRHPRDRDGRFKDKLTKMKVGDAFKVAGTEILKRQQPAKNPKPDQMVFEFGGTDTHHTIGKNISFGTTDPIKKRRRVQGVDHMLEQAKAHGLLEAHEAKPKSERKCKMPHDSLSKQGKLKCPACGANIGQRQKTVEEADATRPMSNYAPDAHFDPDKHPRDKVGRFAAILKGLEPGVSYEGVHEAVLPSGVAVTKTALGGHFVVEGKAGNGKQKFKDSETAALAALLADKMGGRVLTEIEVTAERDRTRELIEAPARSRGATANKVASEIGGTAGVVAARVKTGGAVRSGAADVSSGVRAATGRGGKNDPKKPNARGGGDPNSDFEQKHPRGRGGVWIKKGQGSTSNPDPQVSQLQKRLQQLGYGPGAADGAFGPLTEAAVTKFQTDYGLRPTGQVDPATLQTMQNPPAQKLADVQAQNARMASLPNAQGQVPNTSGSAAGTAGTHSRAGGATAAKGSAQSFNAADPNSVRSFQQAHGLTVDGVVGPQTQAALKQAGVGGGGTHAAAGGRASAGSKGSKAKKAKGQKAGLLSQGTGMSGKPDGQVKQVQKALENLGYGLGDGGVDGRYGPDTRRAVEKLQRQHGLEADGVIGPKTRHLIERLAKRAAKPKQGIQSADASIQASVWAPLIDAAREVLALAEADRDEEAYVRARTMVLRLEAAAGEPAALAQLNSGLPVGGFHFFGRGRSKTVQWDPSRHPRDREGKFLEVLGKLKPGDAVQLPDGATVKKGSGGFEVHPVGGVPSNTGSAKEALARVKGDADWRSDSEHDQNAHIRDFGSQAGTGRSAPKPDAKQRVLGLKHGESATVNGKTVKRGPFGGYYVDGMPVANGDDAAHMVTKTGSASPAERERLHRQHVADVARRRKLTVLHSEEKTMSDNLSLRLEEATADRLAAEHLGDTASFTEARARENTLIDQIIEGRAIPADERKKHATVVQNGEHKFPIRPGNKQDAKSALKLVNHAKPPLSPDQKRKVVAKAKRTLSEADMIVEGVEILTGEVLEEAPRGKYGDPNLVGEIKRASYETGINADLPNARIQRRDHVDEHGRKKEDTEVRLSRRDGGSAAFDPNKHPRNAAGEWAMLGATAATDATADAAKSVKGRGGKKYGNPQAHGEAHAGTHKTMKWDPNSGVWREVNEAASSLAKASSHEPVGHGGRNWITTMGEQLPAYIQHIANDLMEKRGKSESNAIQMAIGIVKRWAKGVGNVKPDTRAAAAKAVAEWEALKAKNKARKVAEAESYSDDPAHEAMVKRLKKKGIAHDAAHKMATKALGNKKIAEAYGIEEGMLGLAAAMGPGLRSDFDPHKHPRGRHGQFVDVLGKLRAGVDVKLPHGTTVHPVDAVTNRYVVSDTHGMRHATLGARFTAAYGIGHDRHLPPLGKASPSVGQQHFPQADAINRNFLHDVPTMERNLPSVRGSVKTTETKPDIAHWPRDPYEAARMHDSTSTHDYLRTGDAFAPAGWNREPSRPGYSQQRSDIPLGGGHAERPSEIPSHAELVRRERAAAPPGQDRVYSETMARIKARQGRTVYATNHGGQGEARRQQMVNHGGLGDAAYHQRTAHLARVEQKYQSKSDDQLQQMMSAIKDPVTYAAEVHDLSLEMRRRKGDLAPHDAPHRLAEAVNDGEMQPSENAVPTNAIQAVTDPDKIRALPLAEIAANVAADWGPRASFAAISYLDAMRTSRDFSHTLGETSPMVAVVRNFLQNAGDWDGPVAAVVKSELARRLRIAEGG